MADALELNLLSYLSSCAGIEWHLSETEKAAITGAAFGGVILGSAFCGSMADWYGRKIGFLSATFLVSIGGLLTALSTSYSWLLVSRVIVGFGIGGGNIPFDLLAELLPVQKRGSFLICIEYFWTFGSAFVSLLAWMYLDDYGWRNLALITMIPVVFTSFFAMYYIPESPRWLLTQNRIRDAEEVIRYSMRCNGMRVIPDFHIKPLDNPTTPLDQHDNHNNNNHDTDNHSHNHSHIHDHNQPAPSSSGTRNNPASTLSIILKEQVTLPLWVIWFCFGFGYYGFLLYISRLYSSDVQVSSSESSHNSDRCSFDYSNIFYNSLAEIVGVTLSIFLLDYFGRINIQMTFYALGGVTAFLMGLSMPKNALFMSIALLGRMSVMISTEVTWVVTPELYPTNHRTFAHAICVCMSKIGAFLSPFIIVSELSVFVLGIVLALINFLAVVASSRLPETGKLQLGLLDEKQSKNSNHHETSEASNPIHD